MEIIILIFNLHINLTCFCLEHGILLFLSQIFPNVNWHYFSLQCGLFFRVAELYLQIFFHIASSLIMYNTIHHKSIALQCALLLFEHLVAVENHLKWAKLPLRAVVFTVSALYQPLNNYQYNTHTLNSTLLCRKQSYPLKETT